MPKIGKLELRIKMTAEVVACLQSTAYSIHVLLAIECLVPVVPAYAMLWYLGMVKCLAKQGAQ